MKNRQDDLDEYEQDDEEDVEDEEPRGRRRSSADEEEEGEADSGRRSWKREVRLSIGVLTLLAGGLGGAGYWRYSQNQKAASPLQDLKEAAAGAEASVQQGQVRLDEVLGSAQQAADQAIGQAGAAAQDLSNAAQDVVDNAAAELNKQADRYSQAATDLVGAVPGTPARPSDSSRPDFDTTSAPTDRYSDPATQPVQVPVTSDLGDAAPPVMTNPFATGGTGPSADVAAADPPPVDAAPETAPATPPEPPGVAPLPGETNPISAMPGDALGPPASVPGAPGATEFPPSDIGPPSYETPTQPSSRRRAPATLPVEPAAPVDAPPASVPATPANTDRYGNYATPGAASDVPSSDYRSAAPPAPRVVTPSAPVTPVAPAASRAPGASSPVAATYTVQPQDNYWAIAQKVYGQGGYFKALFEHNRDQYPRAKGLKAGDVISTPPVDVLAARYPDLLPANLKPAPSGDMRALVNGGGAAAPAAGGAVSGPREYVVREGDTLFDIARYELGNAARWSEIYELNKQALGDNVDRLKPGTKLQLPGNDGSAMSFRRGGRYQR